MWSKLDHGFFRNPKTLTVGQDARLLYLAAVCYAGDRLTDGLIPDDALPLVAAEAQVADSAAAVARLVAAGLWHAITGGYKIHDFFDFNPNARQIKARRETSRARSAAYRASKRAARLNGSEGETGTRVRNAHESKRHTSRTANVQRTNRVKDIDSDSDSESSLAPLPPVPIDVVMSEQPEERAPESGRLRAIPKPHELERAATEAHPLFEPLVTLFGKPPARDLPSWRDDITALEEMGATPEDVPIAAEAYTAIMGDDNGRPIPRTRAALIRHWHRCLQAASYPEDVSRVTGGYAPHEAPIVAWSRRQGYAP